MAERSSRYSGAMPGGVQLGAGGGQDGLGAALAGGHDGLGGGQGAAQGHGAVALAGLQVGVARAHGQAVGLADGGADLDPGGHVQVARHPA